MSFSYARNLPTEGGYVLVVAGGGPAGVCAALAGARSGLKVLLLEATGCLGGMGTSGLVCAFDPMANGETQLVRGIMGEILRAMGYGNIAGFDASEGMLARARAKDIYRDLRPGLLGAPLDYAGDTFAAAVAFS